MSSSRTLIVGIGSPHGDDQVGWLVAEQLEPLVNDNVCIRKAKSPADLLDWLDNHDRLILCDACRGMGRVGDIAHWRWPDPALQDVTWSGTHDLAMPVVLALAERLGRLPKAVLIWAIEGEREQAFASPSSRLVDAAAEVVEQIRADY